MVRERTEGATGLDDQAVVGAGGSDLTTDVVDVAGWRRVAVGGGWPMRRDRLKLNLRKSTKACFTLLDLLRRLPYLNTLQYQPIPSTTRIMSNSENTAAPLPTNAAKSFLLKKLQGAKTGFVVISSGSGRAGLCYD